MFFAPKLLNKISASPLRFAEETTLSLYENAPAEIIKNKVLQMANGSDALSIESLSISLSIPSEIQAKIPDYAANEEEYIISLGVETKIYAKTLRGVMYAMATLEQLNNLSELSPMFLYDYPTCSMRGYRVFLPGRDGIDKFKQMIDMLVYYKYNFIILEIGGAMEYKKHPEINEAWVEFCNDVRRYSGRSNEIQHQMYDWEKDSIHCDNGDGSFISQEACREIASYCRERGIEVIPEEPTLSHSDYICLAHREIREREGDEYPDTYCPSNPKSYELVFDLIDEVLDVFNPRYLNIGHDEVYSIGVCPKCRGKNPVDLYVSDITKIHDYLASNGVKTMMWGEKLLNVVNEQGQNWGGAEHLKTDIETGESYVYIPALYKCADKLPRDIIMLDWYWFFDPKHDYVFHNNGYETLFGNLYASEFKEWRRRINLGIKGGFVSNWGSLEDEYMQRNTQTYQLIFSAFALWNDKYDDDMREEIGINSAREYFRREHESCDKTIDIVHSTDYFMPHEFFYDGIFITEEKYKLGDYEVIYADGSTALLPVFYGTHLVSENIDRRFDNNDYIQVFGSALPIELDGKLGFKCCYKNPHPEKEIKEVVYKPLDNKKEIKITVHSISY